METTSIQSALRTIVATEIRARQFAELDPSAKLADYGYNAQRLLRRLDFQGEAPDDLDQITLSQLESLLELQPLRVHSNLKGLTTEARVTRLMLGALASTQNEPTVYNEALWWWQLVHQILWWYAGRDGDEGRGLVRRDSPGRAMASLAALGLLDLDDLASDRAENRLAFCDVLKRLGYPAQVAGAAYTALAGISKKILHDCDGRIQQLLRPHVDRMADALADEVAGVTSSDTFPKEAIRAWTAIMTGLPVTTWSPSVVDFVDKFKAEGVSSAMLAQIRSDMGLLLPDFDESLAQFMEGLCRGCDPEKEADQLCVKQFAAFQWQVECPGCERLVNRVQTENALPGRRRLPAIATGGPPMP
jgi:hypothetical protein